MRLLTYLMIGLLAGCGEMTYKQGGSPQDIARAHEACRGSGDQFSACLAGHGWQKPQVDALDPLFATVTVNDNRQATQPPPMTPMVIPADSAQPALATAAADAVVAANRQEKPSGQATAMDGPEVSYVINSWWKMGAFPQQLQQDQQACERTLGKDYWPNYQTQTYKRAFVVCMHDAGWMAVRSLK